MISIKDTIGTFWYPCPSCKNLVQVKEWGLQICKYEKCGYEFEVIYDFATAEKLLEEVQKENVRERERKDKEQIFRPAVPRLQRVHSGWVMVQQPPTTDPREWYFSDKLLFKSYIEKMRKNL